ncbi:MAG: hypothetical protein VKO44_11210 [Cyanobacteriota bacterium]|nr:hypothetical protein [Cyanobacteriota bacterium]
MAAGQGERVVPGAGGAGLVDADRQPLQNPEIGVDRRRADAAAALGLDQHIGRLPETEGRHMGPAAQAVGLTFTNKTISDGLGSDTVSEVFANVSTIYAATTGGLSISSNGGTSFTNYITANGLGGNTLRWVYANGSSIYAATDGGLSIAQQSDPTPSAVPGPLPLFGAVSAFGLSRKLRRRLRAAATASPCC